MARALWLLLLAIVVTSSSVVSSASGRAGGAASRVYSIKAVLHDNGRVIGAPHVTLREGTPAIVTSSTDQGYSIRFVAEEQPVSAQYGRRVTVRSEIYLRFMNQWRLVASPGLLIPIGKSASFQLSASGRTDRPTGHPFKMTMSVSDARTTASIKNSRQRSAWSEKNEALWWDGGKQVAAAMAVMGLPIHV